MQVVNPFDLSSLDVFVSSTTAVKKERKQCPRPHREIFTPVLSFGSLHIHPLITVMQKRKRFPPAFRTNFNIKIGKQTLSYGSTRVVRGVGFRVEPCAPLNFPSVRWSSLPLRLQWGRKALASTFLLLKIAHGISVVWGNVYYPYVREGKRNILGRFKPRQWQILWERILKCVHAFLNVFHQDAFEIHLKNAWVWNALLSPCRKNS